MTKYKNDNICDQVALDKFVAQQDALHIRWTGLRTSCSVIFIVHFASIYK